MAHTLQHHSKTAKTSLSEDTTTSIETINVEKQDQHPRNKYQTPQAQ